MLIFIDRTFWRKKEKKKQSRKPSNNGLRYRRRVTICVDMCRYVSMCKRILRATIISQRQEVTEGGLLLLTVDDKDITCSGKSLA